MVDQISIFIIDIEENSRRSLKALLREIQRVKITAEAVDLTNAYELVKENKPDIVILDLLPTVDHALKLAEKITQNLPETTLFVTSAQTKPEVIINAMRAGAREFLSKPLNKDELINAVKSVIRTQSQRKERWPGGKMVSVFGVKGGVGTTTIATNLAVNLANHTKKSVVLVDLNLQFGHAALFLNIQPRYSIVEVANNLEKLDSNILQEVLPRHSSGVCLLVGPSRVEEAESIVGAQLDQILSLLRTVFDFIIIDTNDVLDDLTLKALDASDSILTVFTVDLPTVYNTRRCLDIFQRMGYGSDKVLLVMNRSSSNPDLVSEELEKSIKYPVFWRIPNQDYATIVGSINKGFPISVAAPRSKASFSLNKLAERLNGGAPALQSEVPRNHKGSLIKSLFLRQPQSE